MEHFINHMNFSSPVYDLLRPKSYSDDDSKRDSLGSIKENLELVDVEIEGEE